MTDTPPQSPAWLESLLATPSLARLLRSADEAASLMASRPRGEAPEIREALDSIHRDLGRAVHALAREHGATSPPSAPSDVSEEEAGFGLPETTDTPSAGPSDGPSPLGARSIDPLYDDDWYTDESASPDAPLFGADDLPDEPTDVPGGEIELAEPVPAGPVRVLEDLLVDADAPTGALFALRSESGDPPEWKADLDDLLGLIALPLDLVDVDGMPEEASKVQWASGELDHRLPRFPEAVQLALLALLAARVRNLQGHLDLDIGARLALDRMRRYRELNDLAWVIGLLPGSRPEGRSWADDAMSWWKLLRPPTA